MIVRRREALCARIRLTITAAAGPGGTITADGVILRRREAPCVRIRLTITGPAGPGGTITIDAIDGVIVRRREALCARTTLTITGGRGWAERSLPAGPGGPERSAHPAPGQWGGAPGAAATAVGRRVISGRTMETRAMMPIVV